MGSQRGPRRGRPRGQCPDCGRFISGRVVRGSLVLQGHGNYQRCPGSHKAVTPAGAAGRADP